MKINLIRTGFGFLFASDDDAERARKIKAGVAVTADVKIFRNVKLHRKFWALVHTAWEFLNEQQQEFFHNSVDGFRNTLTLAAGYYDTVYSVARREWVQIPKSIAFDKMTEAEFDQLYEAVVGVIFKLFLNRVNKDEFYEALKNF